jgi:hypothetical protein
MYHTILGFVEARIRNAFDSLWLISEKYAHLHHDQHQSPPTGTAVKMHMVQVAYLRTSHFSPIFGAQHTLPDVPILASFLGW